MPTMSIEYFREYARKHGQNYKYKYHAAYRIRLKHAALTFYGNGNLACVLCGEDDVRCLSLDHINGNGHKHRNSLGPKGRGGYHFYLWLSKQGFPNGYRTLCMNCQFRERDKIYARHDVH